MKPIQLLAFSAILIAFAACKKNKTEDPAPSTNNTTKGAVIDRLCQTWTLKETFENNVQKTLNGTDKYQFTRQGAFNYQYMGKWEQVGTFDFSKDSAYINMTFTGTSMPTRMDIKDLDEKVFNLQFLYDTTTYLYKYTR